MRLYNRSVIVTGSSTGIGKAIAIRCVEEGANVVITGLEKNDCEEVYKTIGAEKSTLVIGDVTEEAIQQEIVEAAVKKFGRLDALINNAAWITSSNIHTTDDAFLKKVLDINLVAPLSLIKLALPHLSKSKGCVVNIGSVNAYCGEPNLLAYSISKGGLMTMSRNLGDTLFRENGVRVNQVNPGWILTEREIIRKREQGMKENWYEDLPPEFAPAGRLILPEEIADAVIYFLDGSASGQILDVAQYPYIGRNLPKS
ncbi:MAG: SDR family oxidoreductase [Chitinophagaceae bacterium]|nr:SDR family oxidoreductase [Chitinophagaceae bacterium]